MYWILNLQIYQKIESVV